MSSLLREILERIEFERLIEEGRDPVELLHHKFQDIPSDVIDKVIEIDPTNKKSYSQWLLSKWDDEKNVILDNLDNGRIEKLFQYYKNRNDIQLKDCPSVKIGLDTYIPEENTVLVKSDKETTVLMNKGMGWTESVPSELANDFDVVFNEDNWVIAVPHTYEADCKLGENTKWCTAGGRSDFRGGRRYYDHYLEDDGGRYYVNFDMGQGETRYGKDYPFTRYQFHFESNQFMDSNDDSVSLSDIGMPESAKDFYINEGYSEEDFEDEGAKFERYEEQRGDISYFLAYGYYPLYLCIEYDNDYEYHEPDEDTPFFLFGEDSRDPILYEEILNPWAHEDAVILKSENICILKTAHFDKYVVAVNKHPWWACALSNYLVLPQNMGVIGVEGSNYAFISMGDYTLFKHLNIGTCEKIFVNENCTNAYGAKNKVLFVEAVADGYHTLFMVSNDSSECEILIKKDIPVNGNSFEINEKGMIDGKIRSYRVYSDEDYDDEYDEWNFETELTNGDYLISYDDKFYNVLKPKTKKLLSQEWFNGYISQSGYLYCFKKGEKLVLINKETGEQIGGEYKNCVGFDAEHDIVLGYMNDYDYGALDMIDGRKSAVIGTFHEIISRKANNKVIVSDVETYTTRIFDYVECKYCFPELGDFRKVYDYQTVPLFSCRVLDTNELVLFDLNQMKIVASELEKVQAFDKREKNFIILTKTNGKVNVYNAMTSSEILPYDADAVIGVSSNYNIVVFEANGKSYPYNYKDKRVLINPNGLGVYCQIYDNGNIICEKGDYTIVFKPNENGEYNLEYWYNSSRMTERGRTFDRQTTPQEVLVMYSLIYGQQESFISDFKKYMNRINEVRKLR